MSKYQLAVDVGGTFTDVFIFNEETKEISVTKVSSTPHNPAEGIMTGITQSNVSAEDIHLFSHGTTVGLNALITRNLPNTVLITTKGFRDVPEIRRGTKLELWDAYEDVAPPYIKRRNRFEVEERVDYQGELITPLNELEARDLARILKKRGVESVAICFINAYNNGINELRMKQILQEELPDVYICTSSETLPEIFEHERMSTTIVNAVLGPLLTHYIQNLTLEMREKGYKGDVLLLHSGGGVMTSETVSKYGARIASSGIAAGAIAGSYIAKLCGFNNAIGLDMGGTSTDISLMYNGDLRITKEWYIEYGYPIGFPSIEILTIGAGGGSLAWIDNGGSLRNGPQSAGADPGPACYMKGGVEPTNTDANVLLGRLNTKLLSGKMTLNKEASAQVIQEKIGNYFNLSDYEAANSIVKVANANMCDALRLISVRRGYDPRDFALVVFGGAGALHGAHLAKEMEIPTVIVPPFPGITSAMGCLLVDVRHDLSKTYHVRAADVTSDELEKEFMALEKEAIKLLQAEGIEDQDMNLIRYLDMRYMGQWRSLEVPLSRPVHSLEEALDRFHQEHQREFAYSDRSQVVEIHGLRVAAVGTVPKPALPKYEPVGTLEEALVEYRDVYFEEAGGMVKTPIYARDSIPTLSEFTGPAIAEQMDSTTVIPPGFHVKVDEYKNMIMTYEKKEEL
ncbi:hydantoinase/oxoprolinase family protein [Ammoniphilus sp. CFH 90114]|uniref:hydantoinase/oxoprolinase family protein n=1 Tax=Ammoniphilus sp. CFH 90114 TaxID=2493665 RepID=UPI00100F49F7|nr:hydantoinase/oxoprolinase family protein [Ammoniphilus sp. CFH 90114]RXT07125.1 hydantoinase/oxoprolinase family protein [Ammoniphilus sp. CFH 90114]